MSVILCTAGYDHTIRFWEALDGICSRTIQYADSQVNRLCISPDKQLLAAAGYHLVKLFEIRSTNPAPVVMLEGHRGNITGVAFHCEGKWMVTSSEDGTVKIWETCSGYLQRSYSHDSPVNDVVIHPNQAEIISCDRAGWIRVWDLAENNCSHKLIPEEDVAISSVTIATDGSLLCAASSTGFVYVWRLIHSYEHTKFIPLTQFRAHKQYITRILLSPDIKKLATCSADHTAKIWEVRDVEPGTFPDPHTRTRPPPTAHWPNIFPSVQASSAGGGAGGAPAGGLYLASGTANDVAHIACDDEQAPYPLAAVLRTHQRWVWDCAFSADSAYLVTVCSDHYTRLWELETQTIIRQYNGHHRGAVCVALNDYSER